MSDDLVKALLHAQACIDALPSVNESAESLVADIIKRSTPRSAKRILTVRTVKS